jgi:hypothetical protein
MKPSRILALKQQSLKKWQKIVANLQTKPPKTTKIKLDSEDCGYCKVYLEQRHTYGWYWADLYTCKPCPLNKKPLCFHGRGKSYLTVLSWAAHHENTVKALQQAKIMLHAVEKDLSRAKKTIPPTL